MLGVAAQRRTIVRTTSMTRDVVFSRAVRSSIEQSGTRHVEQEIPLPGLPHLESQVVAPLVGHGELLGILCIQSDEVGRFLVDDERVIQVVGRHLAASMATLRNRPPAAHPAAELHRVPRPSAGVTSTIKHYQSDDSIFVDEIRLDESLQLPDVKDNLEARLILLRRRLADKSEVLRLVPEGRGRFRLDVRHPLVLVEHS